jgi:hypothetical protein
MMHPQLWMMHPHDTTKDTTKGKTMRLLARSYHTRLTSSRTVPLALATVECATHFSSTQSCAWPPKIVFWDFGHDGFDVQL